MARIENLEAKIIKATEEVEKAKETLKKKQALLDDLLKKQEKAKTQELISAINNSNKSLDEILKFINE